MMIKKILARAGGLIYQGKTNEKKVALTFDDGPNDIYTRQILDILERENIPAAFFVSGEQAEKYPELLRLIADKGHVIGNHSYKHSRNSDMIDGHKKTEDIIGKICRGSLGFFRPPWGRVTFKLMNYCRANKIKIILWSLDSEDYKIKDSRELVVRMAKCRISPGDIILFHDDYSHTVEALPEIIRNIRSQGFSFAPLKEIIT